MISGLAGTIELIAVAYPAKGDTVEDLIKKLESSGNEILEVYNDSVLIAHTEEEF